jgi:protein TonB
MVFEQRNRNYGAYDLRKSYSKLLLFALLGTLGFVGVAIGLPKVMSMFGEDENAGNMLKKEVMVELQQAEEDKAEEEPPPPPPPPPPPQIQQLQFTPPVATNEEVEEEPPTQEEVQNTNVGETTQEGENIDAPPQVEVNQVVEDEIFDAAALSEQAEPNGGMAAFYDFLKKNMKYPAMEKESGIEGKVYVSFVVSPDGTLSDFVIKRSVSKGLDNEAVRVIKASPKWTPGKMGGKAVKSRFTLPINFKLG